MPHNIGQPQRHGRFALPWRTLLLALLAVLGYLFTGPAPEAWVYSREAVGHHQWWTLITGHWMHSDLQHAVWNITALLILGTVFEQQLGARVLSDLLFASALLSVWLFVAMPDLPAYCGLSGILNTLLVTGTAAFWQRYRNPAFIIILLLALVKSLVELSSQQALFTHTAWPSVPEAHLVGMAIGVLIAIYRYRTTLWERPLVAITDASRSWTAPTDTKDTVGASLGRDH